MTELFGVRVLIVNIMVMMTFGLPELAGKSCDNKYIHDSGWGLELKRRLGQGKFAVSQIQRLLCCSPELENTFITGIIGLWNSADHSFRVFFSGERFLPRDQQV